MGIVERTQSLAGQSWNALPGFRTRELCAVNAKENLAVWRQFKDAVISDNPVTFTRTTTMIHICLSDDEDPRRQQKPLAPKQPIT